MSTGLIVIPKNKNNLDIKIFILYVYFVSPATIAPELIIHSEFGGSFLTNPGFLVPVLSALIVAIGLGAGLVWYWRKSSLRGKKGERTSKSF